MPIRNQHWYDRNESRKYPLTDAATAVTDDGEQLPSDLIADLVIRYPRHLYGPVAYIGAVSVSENLVTVIVMSKGLSVGPLNEAEGCDSASGSASAGPVTGAPVALAAATLTKPIDLYRHVPLEPFVDGVGGWVVFGDGANERSGFSGRFSTAEQSEITLHAGQASLPRNQTNLVNSIGKLYSGASLTGLVLLKAGTDIEITGGLQEITPVFGYPDPGPQSVELPAIRIGLKEQADLDVFEEYAGPCSGRPESKTCGDPQPIELINSVAPDCDGNITIEFIGCAEASQFVGDPCGAVLDCGFGLAEVCPVGDRLPDEEGNLPGGLENDCDRAISASGSVSGSFIGLPGIDDCPEPEEDV